jgi:sulfatase maturation enzyme AslB (radical SAM superfamily)
MRKMINRRAAAYAGSLFSTIPRRPLRRWLQLPQSAGALWRLIASDSVRLEVSSKCQLKCPVCPTAKGINRNGVVGWGNLTLDAFERFISDNPRIGQIEISNWGEIFLNPALNEIVRCAHQSGIVLTANNGVNFNSVRDDTLEVLVKYRFRSLTIALDGATPESYGSYRKNGDFDRVIANIEKLNEYKRQYRSRYPILTWQLVIFGHNEHELARARSMARALGMKFSAKLNAESWGPRYSPVKDREMVRAQSGFGVASLKEFREKYGRDYLVACEDLWIKPQVNWDGKLLGCCVNMWGDFGNAFQSGLEKSRASEKYVYAQKMLLGEVEARSDIPCVHCDLYQNHALRKLLETTWSPGIARKLLSASVANGPRENKSAVARLGMRVFDGAREISALLRTFRAWRNRNSHRLRTAAD